jgi:hypothetical protein
MNPTLNFNHRDSRDNETLAEALKRYEDEKAKREPLLVDQGKMEGGLDEVKIA